MFATLRGASGVRLPVSDFVIRDTSHSTDWRLHGESARAEEVLFFR